MKHTDAEVARYRAMHLGRSSQSETSMRIVRDDLGTVHVGDQVRYAGYGGQFQADIRFRSKVGSPATSDADSHTKSALAAGCRTPIRVRVRWGTAQTPYRRKRS